MNPLEKVRGKRWRERGDRKPSKQPKGAPANVLSKILKLEKLNIKSRFPSVVIKVQRALGLCNEWVAEELGPAHIPLFTTSFITPSLVILIHMFVCPFSREEYLLRRL